MGLWKKLQAYPKIFPLPFYTPLFPTLVIAHRGASAVAPENTLAAFEAAICMGADMIELDLQLSRDEEMLVFHDRHLKRTSNGNGKFSDFSLSVLKALDVGSWFHSRFHQERIPHLEEVLDLCAGKIMLNVEIKGSAVSKQRPLIEQKLLDALKKHKMLEHTMVSSFNLLALQRLKQLEPRLSTALLYGNNIRSNVRPKIPIYGYHAFKMVYQVRADALNMRKNLLTRGFLKKSRLTGLHVHPFTIDNPRLMKKLVRKDVHGIITNTPDRLLQILHQSPYLIDDSTFEDDAYFMDEIEDENANPL